MHKARVVLRRLWQDERGATTIEYALMVSLIAITALIGAAALGTKVQALYVHIQDRIAATIQ